MVEEGPIPKTSKIATDDKKAPKGDTDIMVSKTFPSRVPISLHT